MRLGNQKEKYGAMISGFLRITYRIMAGRDQIVEESGE
jgi:hypothetical protein